MDPKTCLPLKLPEWSGIREEGEFRRDSESSLSGIRKREKGEIELGSGVGGKLKGNVNDYQFLPKSLPTPPLIISANPPVSANLLPTPPIFWIWEEELSACPKDLTSLVDFATEYDASGLIFSGDSNAFSDKLNHSSKEVNIVVTNVGFVADLATILSEKECAAGECLKLWLDQCPSGMHFMTCATASALGIWDCEGIGRNYCCN
jgi:hypothetical protein